ncbi:MAG: FtsX-like permease family protein, partial [Acidobacteriota bacterium]
MTAGGWRAFLSQLRRESRGSGTRLIFFVLCLAVGVAAVVGVSTFSAGLDSGIRREARSLLAADLAIRSRKPIEDTFHQAVDALPGSARASLLETLTVVAVELDAPAEGEDSPEVGESLLTEMKAASSGYPFYGDLVLDPPRPLDELLTAETAIVAPELLDRLKLEIGDRLRVGGESFTIAGTVLKEPDRVGGAFSLGPRLFLSLEGVERARLRQFGSRIVYRTLIRLPPMDDAELSRIAEELGTALDDPDSYQIETYRQAQPALREGLDRMEAYVGLAALLSLIVGGVGVAQTVRAWLAGRLDAIAIYRCLGYRPREVAALYLAQAALLAFGASVLGVVLGVALVAVPRASLAGVLPVEHLNPIQPLA